MKNKHSYSRPSCLCGLTVIPMKLKIIWHISMSSLMYAVKLKSKGSLLFTNIYLFTDSQCVV